MGRGGSPRPRVFPNYQINQPHARTLGIRAFGIAALNVGQRPPSESDMHRFLIYPRVAIAMRQPQRDSMKNGGNDQRMDSVSRSDG